MKTNLTILVSSVGRRGQLVECFRRAAHEMDIQLRVLGTDADPSLSPASHLVDQCYPVARCSHPQFVDDILRICRSEKVALVIPTIDPELPVYAEARRIFESLGTKVLISSPQTVAIAGDKVLTNRWFVENGLPTVRQKSVADSLNESQKWKFPVIVKPRRGSASVGVRIVRSVDELQESREVPDLIVEELAQGKEHTTNIFVDENGKCLCAVPHRRIETRGGEVSKGITVKNEFLMALARRAAEALPGARGPMNFQAFIDEAGQIRFTEINARFGGGFPLAFEAGANFCRWIFESLLGRHCTASFSGWQDNLLMLRFDRAVFIPARDESR